MGLPRFEYFAPESLEEVCRILKDRAPDVKLMAGGTDLLIKMKNKVIRPTVVVGLKRIPGLNEISCHPKTGLKIGATALLSDVAGNRVIKRRYPAISLAASNTGTVQIRNMGTVVGNICNASPSGDNIPSLIAYGARVILKSMEREREVLLEDFFTGPGKTIMRDDEMVTHIVVPPPEPSSGVSSQAISKRSKVDISAAIVSAYIKRDGEKCKDARIVLGAVAPTPIRAKKAERLLIGKKLTKGIVEKASVQASKESSPITDMRASKEYRKHMVEVLSKRAIYEACKMANLKI